jgi:hypothetical protein
MPSHNPGEASHEPRRDGDIAESRVHLSKLETDNADEARYWLYEHLRRLAARANALLEDHELVRPPIDLGAILKSYINPLNEIYSNLREYYWRRDCLLELLAAGAYDQQLLMELRKLRKQWNQLANSMKEYVAVRQLEQETPARSAQRLTTGSAFHQEFLAFVESLLALVHSGSFKAERARLESSAGLTSGSKGRRMLTREHPERQERRELPRRGEQFEPDGREPAYRIVREWHAS